ncbi:MAG: methyltransferase domain-containing protein [Solobacterium sp.]|nr:methyltransferase domain-containing protein [Solobacterium sp.]
MDNQTLDYYNKKAEEFAKGTVDVEFTATQDRFLSKLPDGATILDFGCGAGRDTKYFISKGYKVTATDGSEEMCKYASKYTGIEVRLELFQELSEVNVYDGIWACSSILHLTVDDLKDVFAKMQTALKDNGVIYTSFKYSDFEGDRHGRYFTDMTESKFADFMTDIDGLHVEEQWITEDVRPGRSSELWLNLLLRKN